MVHIALGDGSVRAITKPMDRETYHRLVAVEDGVLLDEL